MLATLSNKWVTLVICLLGEHEMRYSEISQRLAGVSQKMLTQTLRQLERDGLISRTVTPTVPVRVDYAPALRLPPSLGTWRSFIQPISGPPSSS